MIQLKLGSDSLRCIYEVPARVAFYQIMSCGTLSYPLPLSICPTKKYLIDIAVRNKCPHFNAFPRQLVCTCQWI